MSRVGKYPVALPPGVTVALSGRKLTAKGRWGELSLELSEDIAVELRPQEIAVRPLREDRHARTMWGTTRSLINAMVTGVAQGFSKALEINGTGYRAAVQGSDLVLNLGFSHEIRYPIPPGIRITCEKPTAIRIEGANKQQVGQVAAEIRALRPPEPYKGKGIKYVDEVILRKEGKKK